MMHTWEWLSSKKTLIGLILGQFASLLITSTGFSSSQLSRRGINAPASQSFLNYLLLAIFYGGILLHRRRWLQMKWYYYVLLAIVDVEANYLVVKAYQYTSLTSVMLLDCCTIPCVIFLTWMFLKTKYGLRKFAGVGICVAGLVLVVFSDVHFSDRTGGSNPLKGDILVVAGSMLYAVSNVSEEFLVREGNKIELMAMLGFFGALISGCQISVLERNELRSINWTAGAVLPFVGYALAMFLFYSTVPIILKICGSAMLNLSLLTSDMWAVLIRIFAYHQKVDWMYFLAFAAVAFGLCVYSMYVAYVTKGLWSFYMSLSYLIYFSHRGFKKQTTENTVNEGDNKERDEEAGFRCAVVQSSTAAQRVGSNGRNMDRNLVTSPID